MLALFFLMVAVLVLMSVLIILVMVMMFIAMSMFMLVMMMLVRTRVSVRYAIRMRLLVAMFMREVNIEFNPFDGGFVSAGNVQMVAVEIQLFQFVLQFVRINTEVEQRADKHVAADAAEDVEI
jgi:hypothetical protein